MPVIMFIPSLSFVAGKKKQKQKKLLLEHAIFRFFLIDVEKLIVMTAFMCFIHSSNKSQYPRGKHDNVLHLRDLHYARWHSSGRLDRCNVITDHSMFQIFYFFFYYCLLLIVIKVLQGTVMISSVLIIALFGIWNVGGLTEVWNRAVEGGRIFPPEYVKMFYFSNVLMEPN